MLMPPTPALMSLQQSLNPHAHAITSSPTFPNGHLPLSMMAGGDTTASSCTTSLMDRVEAGSTRHPQLGAVSDDDDDEDETYSLDDQCCSQDDQMDDLFYEHPRPAGGSHTGVPQEDDKDVCGREGAAADDDERANHSYRELF